MAGEDPPPQCLKYRDVSNRQKNVVSEYNRSVFDYKTLHISCKCRLLNVFMCLFSMFQIKYYKIIVLFIYTRGDDRGNDIGGKIPEGKTWGGGVNSLESQTIPKII